MYVLIALLAAATYAVSTVLKHRSAQDLGQRASRRSRRSAGHDGAAEGRTVQPPPSRGLMPLILGTVRHPLWLVAIGVDALALTLQILALHLGPLATVQPILVSSLLFALVFNGGATWRDMVWPGALLVSLAGLIVVTGRAPAHRTTVDLVPTIVAAVALLIATLAGLLVARQPRPRRWVAPALGVGVGIIYATTAALLKALSDRAVSFGVAGVLTSWQLYAVIAVGGSGLLLNQAAFRAGSLRASLATISVVDPIASICLGAAVYDEPLPHGPLSGPVAAVAMIGLVLATVQICRQATAAERTAGATVPPFDEEDHREDPGPEHLLPAGRRWGRDSAAPGPL